MTPAQFRHQRAPRIQGDLDAEDLSVSQKEVASLMRKPGFEGASRRNKVCTTKRDDPRAPPRIRSSGTSPTTGWIGSGVADIGFIPIWAGYLYLELFLAAWSRRVVGWAMGTHLRTELFLEAHSMPLRHRRPVEVIYHSDQGYQYTSLRFGGRWRELGGRPSMGSVGDCYDNAACESLFATPECKGLDPYGFPMLAATTRARSYEMAPLEAGSTFISVGVHVWETRGPIARETQPVDRSFNESPTHS